MDSRVGVGLDADQDVGQVLLGIDAVRLAGGDEGVEPGEVLPGLFVSDEEVVLPAKCRDAEGTFCGVVVEREAGVVEELRQCLPLFEGVADCIPNGALGRMQGLLLEEPFL